MNKKGFTLIELLAVILILGIIALIAIPTVNNILKESRQGAFNASMQNIIKAAEEKCLTEHMKGNTVRQFIFSNGKVSPSLDVKGDLPKSGIINLNENCEATATLSDGDRKYVLTYEGSSVEECTSNSCSFASNLKEGDEKYQCFNFDEETGTILKYDGSNPICQGDVYIPAMINSIPVTKIHNLAFVGSDVIYCKKDEVITNHESSYIPKEEDGYCYVAGNNFSINSVNMSDAGYLTEISDDAFIEAGLTEVKFNDNLRKIGNYVFSGNNLTDVVLPKKLEEMGDEAFAYNPIEHLVINNKLKIIPQAAFANSSLKAINIPEGVEYIHERAFTELSLDENGTEVYISDTVIGIGKFAFEGSRIKKLKLGKNIEIIGRGAFRNNLLVEINIPSSVKEIGIAAFTQNKLTENVFIYNLNSDGTENKKSLNSYAGYAENLIIPNGVEELGEESVQCAELKSVTLPEGLKYIRGRTFAYANLTTIEIPSTVEVIEQLTLLKYSFSNPNLTTIINKTGRAFNWGSATNSSTTTPMVTGTINNSFGNITVTQ